MAVLFLGGGCGYDVVSMEMDDTSPLDLFGLHSHSHGRSLHAHSAAGVPGNGLAPGQSMMVPSFMHHSMGKGISIRKYPCKMCSQVSAGDRQKTCCGKKGFPNYTFCRVKVSSLQKTRTLVGHLENWKIFFMNFLS